jgi:hypothetical protein
MQFPHFLWLGVSQSSFLHLFQICTIIHRTHAHSIHPSFLISIWFKFMIMWLFFSSPGPKGQVSYCHHLASVVVRRKLFQRSSPLKLLDQLEPNLVWIITRVSSFKLVSDDAMHQSTWPLLLKIEHMVKLQVF